MDRITDFFDELRELGEEYEGYKCVPIQSIQFNEPENDYQRALAKRLARSGNFVLITVLVAFVATLAYAIYAQSNFIVIGMFASLCILIGIIVFKQFSRRVMVSTGIAIMKQRHKKSGHHSYYYTMTFVPDGDQKVLATRIRINRNDYDRISKGTRVMVVNRGYNGYVIDE